MKIDPLDKIKALIILKDTFVKGDKMPPFYFAKYMWLGTPIWVKATKSKVSDVKKKKNLAMMAGKFLKNLEREGLVFHYNDIYGKGIEYFITSEGTMLLNKVSRYLTPTQ